MFPISLQDYFSHLTPELFFVVLLILMLFEIVGDSIMRNFNTNNSLLRITHWMVGFGVYCFLWFILNLFVPLNKNNVLLSLLPFIFFIPSYIKRKGYTSLISSIYQLSIPILLLLPLYLTIFSRASLPPYLTDEMAYQFISPQDLVSSKPWEFSGGLYQVIPKNLNVLFHTTFALTNTYSVARLIHFFIFLTATLTAYTWLKQRFGFIQALVFWLMTYFVYQPSLIEAATSGYVDIGTASFLLCMIVVVLEIYQSKKLSLIPYFFMFAGLALGSKYSAIFGFVGWFGLLATFFLINKKTVNVGQTTRLFIVGSLIFIVTGGFWYLKNFAYTGNPIYPFLFGCRGSECIGNSSFFGDWTTRINLRNIPAIFNDLLVGNRKLEILAVFSFLICALSKSKKLLVTNLLLITGILIEFGFMRMFSGFLLRYFWHLQFLIFMFISLQTYSGYKDLPWMRIIRGLFTFILILFLVVNYIRNSVYAFYPDRLPSRHIKYAFGLDSIYDWTKDSFPQMHTVVEWCDSQRLSEPIWLYRVDPDLVWFTFEGQMRVYMTNCRISDFGPDPKLGHEKAYDQLKQNIKTPAWFASLNPCQKNEDIKYLPWETEHQRFLRRANNNIICNLKEVIPHLYYFEP